jgi:hypothetical protein
MTILSNPNGAHRTVSNFATGQDDDGNELVFSDQAINSYQAGGTIAVGQALMLVAPTATAGPTVVAMTTAVAAPNADVWRFCGVAMEAASSGGQVRVCSSGIVRVLHDALSDPAVYDLLVLPLTSTGEFDLIAGTPVDDTVCVGYFLSVTDAGTTDTALAYICPGMVTRFATA